MRPRTACGALAAVAVLLTGAAPNPVPGVRIAPRAHPESSYTLEGRVQILNKDISFEAPPAYHDSFAFWTGRLKGVKKTERIELLTLTREARDDGSVPYRRIVPRYMIEFLNQGSASEPVGSLKRDVTTLVWEGVLDPRGNVTEKRKVGGEDNPGIPYLAFPLVEYLFPRFDAPRTLKPGESFTDVASLPMPARVEIHGLEAIRLRLSREYVLKQNRAGRAEFAVSATYALDPATPPTEPQTTCVISGGGAGTAVFDVARGVFLEAQLPTTLIVDVKAPLHPLPGMEETKEPALGTVHLELFVNIAGKQKVVQMFGKEAPAAR